MQSTVEFTDIIPSSREAEVLEINLNDEGMRDAEAVKALVEYTWKQESVDKITDELSKHIERISDEVKKAVEKQAVEKIKEENKSELAAEVKMYVRKMVDDSKADMEKRLVGELKQSVEKRVMEKRRDTRLYLTIALSIASLGLGIAIAALAGLLS